MRGRTAFALLLSASACTESGSSGSGAFVPPTLVVDPAQFRGDVPCVAAPGGLRRYVATLVDVTRLQPGFPDVDGFVLPSSSPTSCDLPVHFHRISDLHAYVADIQGYDRDDLTPIATGSPILADADGNIVAPRWTTSCGRGQPEAGDAGDAGDAGHAEAGVDDAGDGAVPDATPSDAALRSDDSGDVDAGDADANPFSFSDFEDATIAYFPQGRTTVLVRNCLPFVDQSPSTAQTGVVIEIAPTASGLACGDASGQVGRFEASLDGGTTLGAACGQSVTFEGLNPGDSYTFDVTAFDGGSDAPTWTTECFRVAEPGLILRALCDPLRPAE